MQQNEPPETDTFLRARNRKMLFRAHCAYAAGYLALQYKHKRHKLFEKHGDTTILYDAKTHSVQSKHKIKRIHRHLIALNICEIASGVLVSHHDTLDSGVVFIILVSWQVRRDAQVGSPILSALNLPYFEIIALNLFIILPRTFWGVRVCALKV